MMQAYLVRVLIFLAVMVAAWVGGCTHERIEWKKLAAINEGIADAKVEGLESELELSKRTAQNQVRLTYDVLNSELDGLRSRPPRRVEVIKSGTCTGVTGAELSAEDGEFLVREAARAERILIKRNQVVEQFNSLLSKCVD